MENIYKFLLEVCLKQKLNNFQMDFHHFYKVNRK